MSRVIHNVMTVPRATTSASCPGSVRHGRWLVVRQQQVPEISPVDQDVRVPGDPERAKPGSTEEDRGRRRIVEAASVVEFPRRQRPRVMPYLIGGWGPSMGFGPPSHQREGQLLVHLSMRIRPAQGRACRTALSAPSGAKDIAVLAQPGVVQLLPKEIEDLLDHHNCRPAYEHAEFEVVAGYSGARDIGAPDVCGGRIRREDLEVRPWGVEPQSGDTEVASRSAAANG